MMMLSQDMMTAADEREKRAEQWLRQASDRLLATEPDWWLRMVCGQIFESDSSLSSPVMGQPRSLR